MAKFSSAPWIQDEAAYNRAVGERIKHNANIGRKRRWQATYANAEAIETWLRSNARGGFLAKMVEALDSWGALSDGQHAAVAKIMAQRQAEETERNENLSYVGQVGKRQEFDVTVAFLSTYESDFGITFVNGFTDESGNLLIHKGSPLDLTKGDRVRLRATVKAHQEHRGAKQTILSRPMVLA